MGGFSRGSSSGNSGPAGRKSSGSYGTARDARRASRRNEGRKAASQVANFIKDGGVTGTGRDHNDKKVKFTVSKNS